MNEMKTIRDQINQLRSTSREPTKIYMDGKTAAVLCDEMHAVCRFQGALASGWQIMGLRVKVHEDFPSPVVYAPPPS
jgi:hypothetical protein